MAEWLALPPEVNTGRLQAGEGAGPMFAAATAFEAQAAAYESQAAVLSSTLANTAADWQGAASTQSMAAAVQKLVPWLHTAAVHSAERGGRSYAQGMAYQTAYTATPQLPEIAQNHITNAVLNATNFLGINTVPIAYNEADYVRMWTQAAGVMTSYMMETMTNLTALSPILPPLPTTLPGVGMESVAQSGLVALTGTPEAAGRNATLMANTANAVITSGRLALGEGVAQGLDAERRGEHAAALTALAQPVGQETAQQSAAPADSVAQSAQTMQMIPQTVSQVGSQVSSAPQSLTSGLQQPMSMLTSPIQQFTGMLGQGGGFGTDKTGAEISQVGMFDLDPQSQHPMAGGVGPVGGGGMYGGGAVPGSAGASPRTPLLAALTSSPATAAVTSAPAASAGADPAAVRAGAAPVGMMPTGGMHGKRSSSTATVDPLSAPAPLQFGGDDDFDPDDWG